MEDCSIIKVPFSYLYANIVLVTIRVVKMIHTTDQPYFGWFE